MADEKEVAVVEDKPLGDPEPDFSKKHPLEHAWTLWFDNPNGRSKQSTWGQTLRTVYTFSTVEDFWCLYNNIVPPSRLPHGADFHLFKEGIEPKWEDAKCAQGGKWNVPVPKSNNKVMLDQMWLHTVRRAHCEGPVPGNLGFFRPPPGPLQALRLPGGGPGSCDSPGRWHPRSAAPSAPRCWLRAPGAHLGCASPRFPRAG
mmetsp:Transcript_24239/g.76263  ORF Transcript_24239/g.76263 Transcript_24239/m.76263 type:complete len:201 (+) Transcript_24239:80-682(+)